MMVLVTGAAGKSGRAVLQALVSKGVSARAWVRRKDQVPAVRALGADDVVVGDVRDTGTWRQAITNIRAIYHICPNMHPQEIEIGRLAIDAARANGIAHFVYHSVLHSQVEAMPHHWHKMRVEELLFASGLPFTILQPAAYMQNVLVGRPSIVNEGIYRIPYPVETVLSMVDLHDVAEVAAIVLTESGHQGAIYECVGPDLLSQTAVATILSQHLNRSVQAAEVSLSTWKQRAMAQGLGDYQIDTLLKMFQYYAQFNFYGNAHVLRWLLDREPTSFATYVQREFA